MALFGGLKKRYDPLAMPEIMGAPDMGGAPMQQPVGGYIDPIVASREAIGVNPMQQPMAQPMEPPSMGKVSALGVFSDFLSGVAGGQANYANRRQSMFDQQRQMQARQQLMEAQRLAGREEKQWEWENKPKDDGKPYRWESNDGSLMEIGADGVPRRVYQDPDKKINWLEVDDGMGGKRIINPAALGAPSMPSAPVGKLTPIGGGSGGNVTGNFQ